MLQYFSTDSNVLIPFPFIWNDRFLSDEGDAKTTIPIIDCFRLWIKTH